MKAENLAAVMRRKNEVRLVELGNEELGMMTHLTDDTDDDRGGANPVIFARSGFDTRKPTVCFYAHYDVDARSGQREASVSSAEESMGPSERRGTPLHVAPTTSAALR